MNKKNSNDLLKILKYFKEDKFILIFHIFLGMICSALMIIGSFFIGEIINNLFSSKITNQTMLKILYGSLITFSLYICYWIINSKILIWTIKLSYRSGSRIRYALFVKLLNVPISYIDKSKVGELMSRATNDIDMMISSMVQVVAGMFTSPIIIISIIIANFVISPLLSVVALFLSFVVVLFTAAIAKKSAPHFNTMQNKLGELNSLGKEYINNKMAIYVFSRQDKIKKNYEIVNDNHKNANYKAEYRIGLVYPLLDILENIIYGTLFVIGLIFIHKNVNHGGATSLNVGIVTTFVLLNRIALGEIGNMARFGSLYEQLFACIKRIINIINEPDDIDSGTNDLKEIKGEIEFKNVNFSYTKNKPIIKDFNLKVSKGQVVAIVGPTGSGKSTIMNLLLRFYEVSSGSITIDGVDIKDIKKSELRRHISIVPQETNLFSESIYTNISYGSNDSEINHNAIHEASQHIGSNHFINILPNSFETIISENIPISQGQSQMLALTRAYYSPSSILILDEATSSIDSKTEQDIQKGLQKLMKSKTSFIIAHRLSTIKDADIIVVLKDGSIIEQGNHELLMKQNGFYAKMYNANENFIDD